MEGKGERAREREQERGWQGEQAHIPRTGSVMAGVGLCLSTPESDGVHSAFSSCHALFDDLGEQQGKGLAWEQGLWGGEQIISNQSINE